MKNRVIFLILGLWISSISFSQNNEYQYLGLRFGASHGFSGTPAMNVNKYLIVPPESDEMQLTPDGNFKAYTPGFVADLYYHLDFTNNSSGVFAGLEYNNTGVTAKYATGDYGGEIYSLIETYRMNTIGVPIAFKYGPKINENQRYIYAGVQFNYTVSVTSVQKASWNNVPSGLKLGPDEYNKTSFCIFLGGNYKVFNFQIDYYPTSIFNKKFKDAKGYNIYEGQVDQRIALKTSINIAHGWLSDNSFWWKKKLRKFPLWK